VLRFLVAALRANGPGGADAGLAADLEEGSWKVVLASWLRDREWWRESGRRLVSYFFVFSS